MKIRAGFVSNSSSSSFVFVKADLSEGDLTLIREHESECELIGFAVEADGKCRSGWTISETSTRISGQTTMDNFPMDDYLTKVGIDPNKAEWYEDDW